jgi:hypothetical protein
MTSGNACYHLVQNLLYFSLLLKNIKIKICKTLIFPVVLDGCKTSLLTFIEEHNLRVFENRVPSWSTQNSSKWLRIYVQCSSEKTFFSHNICSTQTKGLDTEVQISAIFLKVYIGVTKHLTVFIIWKTACQLCAAFVLIIMYSDVW